MTDDNTWLFDIIQELSYLAEEEGFASLSDGLGSCLDLYLLECKKRLEAARALQRPDDVAPRRVIKLDPSMLKHLDFARQRRAS